MDGHEPSRRLGASSYLFAAYSGQLTHVYAELTSQLKHPVNFPAINVTPPRGVLSHGHPGTGTTLSVRALAASYQATGNGFGKLHFFLLGHLS